MTGEWVPIPDAEALTDVELEAASDAAGAMTFVRPEDGAFNPNNPDTVVAAGGDIAISPDNLNVSRRYLMINEDGTTESRAVMAAKGRDGSIWRLDLTKGPVGAVGSTPRRRPVSPRSTRPVATASRSARGL